VTWNAEDQPLGDISAGPLCVAQLTPLRDQSELSISNNPDELKRTGTRRRVILIAGLESKRLILRSFGDT